MRCWGRGWHNDYDSILLSRSGNDVGDAGWLRLGAWLAGATRLTSLNGFDVGEVRGVRCMLCICCCRFGV